MDNKHCNAVSFEANRAIKDKNYPLCGVTAILDAIHEACFELNNEARIAFVNRQALEWWKFSAENVIGQSIWDVLPELNNPEYRDAILYSAISDKKTITV